MNDIMQKSHDIAKVLQLKTAYKDNNKTCYESWGWCRSILYDVLKALEYNRTIARIAIDNGVSFVTARSICYDLTKINGATYIPSANIYGDELTYVKHFISEREGCPKEVVAKWAPELASKIMEAITEFENARALQAT